MSEEEGVTPPRADGSKRETGTCLQDNSKRMKSDKYCHFHRDRGHDTEEYHHLKNETKKLIQRGYLKEFVDQGKSKAQEPTAEVGCTAPHTRWEEAQHEDSESEITFNNQDLEGNLPANNDAIVITATMSNFWVKKILIDSESLADILFYKAYSQMGIDKVRLMLVNTPLTSFSGDIMEPLGEVMLPISLGSYPKRVTKFVKFLVIDSPSAYNVILGRPSLNLFQAVASTYHMKIKFPTPNGVGEERKARECYASTLKKPTTASNMKTK
ncbi:UNVERIFIED_CONTAM: hypothetical protein Slati_2399400 [Sesamum latifolium]|uniref:Uncharacterized protein n=1 Tax=Sesamum latifolium TaxID=2727402 RepID=A0AAW2WBR0_9LAMI